jgi:hypothetical protein
VIPYNILLDKRFAQVYVNDNWEGIGSMPKHHGPRKQPTEAEKAQTPLQEELAGYAPTVKSLATCIDAIELYHKMSHRDAICALRDYFQWLLAAEADKSLEETWQRITELESKLKG